MSESSKKRKAVSEEREGGDSDGEEAKSTGAKRPAVAGEEEEGAADSEPKHGEDEETEEEDEDEHIGPLPSEAQAKKNRVVKFEGVYLENLPSALSYERSYM